MEDNDAYPSLNKW